MEFKNGTTKKPMTYADLEMVSANDKRILLRYIGDLWDDVFFEAAQMVYGVATFSDFSEPEDIISRITMYIGFNVQLKAVRPYADLTVKTKTGQIVAQRFCMVSTDEELINILDHFFSDGCKGVLPEFAEHFIRFYSFWRQLKNKKLF